MTDKRVQQNPNPNENNNWGWPPQTPTLNDGDQLSFVPLSAMSVDVTDTTSDFSPQEEDSKNESNHQATFTYQGASGQQFTLTGMPDIPPGHLMGPSDSTKLTISGGTIPPTKRRDDK